MPPSSLTSIVSVATESATARRQCRYRDGCVWKFTGRAPGSEFVAAGSAIGSPVEVWSQSKCNIVHSYSSGGEKSSRCAQKYPNWGNQADTHPTHFRGNAL